MAYSDYSTTPASNTELADGTYVGPNMLRNKVRPAIQQLMADGREAYDDMLGLIADPAATPFLQAGSGAIERTYQAKLRETVSVRDFGALGTGNDDTAAFAAALTQLAGTKFRLHVPGGDYGITGGLVVTDGLSVHGDGRNATRIISANASPTGGHLFNVSGYGASLRGLGFIAGTTQTAGSFVKLSGTESFIEDFSIGGDFNGILMTGVAARIRQGRFEEGEVGSIRIDVGGGDTSQAIDDVLMGVTSPPNVAAAGIRVRNSSALKLTNCDVLTQGAGLLINPTSAAENVFSLYAENCFFDTCSRGLDVAPTGTGGVYRSRFSSCWFGDADNDGVRLAGLIEGMHFESCHGVLNTASGMSVGAQVEDLTINGGLWAENAHGIYLNNAITGLTITNATIGAGGGLAANTGAGIAIVDAASDDIVITGNRIVGNASSIVDASTTTDKHIANNVGCRTHNRGFDTIASGTSSKAVTHGLAFTPTIADIQLTPAENAGAAGVTNFWVSAVAASTFTVTSNAAASADFTFTWDARVKGA